MDVEIRFEGDARDAEAAVLTLDAALEQIDLLAKQVSDSLGDIKLHPGQAAVFVSEVGMMAAALSALEGRARSTNREMSQVGSYRPGTLLASAITGLPFGQDRRTFAGPAAEQGLVPYNPANLLLRNRVFAQDAQYAQRARAFGGMFDSIGREDSYPIRYGAGMGGRISGPLESYSDRGRGGLLGYLLGASGGGDGNRISNILGGLGDGGGGGGRRGGRRYDVPGPNFLAGILPGGSRARPAALAALGLGAASISPEIGAPVVGALSQIPVLAVTGAAALGTLKLAFDGVSQAIGGNAKEYQSLNAQAQQFVLMVRGLDPSEPGSPLYKAKQAAQAGLFPGVTRGLTSLLSPATQQNVTGIAGQYGQTLGGLAQGAGAYLGSNGVQQMLKQLATTGATGLKDLGATLGGLTDAFLRVGVAARPLTEWFGQMSVKASELVDHFIQGKAETGALADFFVRLEGPISMVARLVEEIVKVLYELVSILAGPGKIALQGLIDLLTGLDHWLQQNHDSLVKVGDFLAHTFVGALELVAPVISMAASGVATLAGAVSSLGGALGALPAVLTIAVAGLVAMATNPQIAALLAAMAALGYIAKSASGTPAGETQMVGATYKGKVYVAPGGSVDAQVLQDVASGKKLKPWERQQLQQDISTGNLTGYASVGAAQAASQKAGLSFGMLSPTTTTSGRTSKGWATPGTEGNYYVSPVRPGTKIARLDQGIDYQGKPGDYVVAIGNAMIDAVKSDPGGFGKAIYYTLEDGPAAGQQIYVGHAQPLVRAGQRVNKGDSIAVLLKSGLGNASGLSGWTEIGFASGNAPVSHSASDTGPAKQFQDFLAGNQTRYSGSASSTWDPGKVPPAQTGTKGILPMRYQIAIARAGTTTGTGDDVSALDAAIHYLRGIIHSLSGQDLLDAYNEIGSLQSNLKSIATAAKRGRSTGSQRLSARNAGSSVLGMIGTALGPASGFLTDATSPLDALDSSPVAAAHDQLAPLLLRQRGEIQAFEKELRDKLISSEAVSTIRSRISSIRQTVTSELGQLKAAAQQQASDFKSIWTDYVQTFDSTFQQQTSDVLAHPEKYPELLPLSAALADLQSQHTQEQLAQALSDAKQQLADALAGVSDTTSLDAARKKISQDALAHAIDVAQSFVLGGIPMDMTDQIIKDMQAALTATTGSADPKAVAAAQRAVADAEYNIKVDGLQKGATAEQTAYQDSRKELQKHLDESLAMWGTYYAKSGETAGQALASLNALLVKFGFTPITDPGGGGANPFPQPGITMIDSSGKLVPVQNSASSPAALFNLLQGRIVGMADGGLVTQPHFLVDMGGQVRGMIGERGAEAISPVGRAMAGRVSGGDGPPIVVEVHTRDEALAGFIDVRVVHPDNVAAVARAQGLSANRRYRAGRF